MSKPLFKETRNGGLIVHSDALQRAADTSNSNIKIPETDATQGAGFGETISDTDRAYAATREPIGHFLTYITAADAVDKWFVVNDPDTEEADPALDRGAQDALDKLKFKRVLREAMESRKIYGKALIVGGFNDAKLVANLKDPLRKGAELMQLATYPKTLLGEKQFEFTVDTTEKDPESPRFGEPVIYKINRGSSAFLFVHYTRVCEVGDGTSVLDKVWDDMTCGRNIRWGAGQWMFRTGGGFPVFGFPTGTNESVLELAANSGLANNLMHKKFICIAQNSLNENNGMTFEFKGAAGAVLDPTPFFKTNIEQMSIATGYPQAKLIGAQAGAVTGSEVNQQEYYKAISREQENDLTDPVRWVIDRLAESRQIKLVSSSSETAVDKATLPYQIRLLKQALKRAVKRDFRHKTAKTYVVDWNSAFELSELDEAQIENQHTQANANKLKYMSKDEVRAEEGLDPLPDGAGEWKDQSDFGGEQFLVQSKQKMGKANAENPNPKNETKKTEQT